MADFGFWELALILLAALFVVGPERLPKLAMQAGEILGKLKRLVYNFKEDLADAADDDLKNTIEQQRDLLQQSGAEINKQLRDLDPLAKSIQEQIETGRFSDSGQPDETMDENLLQEDSPSADDDLDKPSQTIMRCVTNYGRRNR